MLAAVFGSGDGLDIALVIALVGATVTISGWLWRRRVEEDKRFATINLRLALIEQAAGLTGKSGVHRTVDQ